VFIHTPDAFYGRIPPAPYDTTERPEPPRSTLIPNEPCERKRTPRDMPEVDVNDFTKCADCDAPVLADFEHRCPARKQIVNTLLSATERKAVSGIPTRVGWSCHLCGASNSPYLQQCPCKLGESV
jgi:hypothetical protein